MGSRGLQAKYLLLYYCNRDSLKFDVKHDIVQLNFDLLIPLGKGGGGLCAHNLLPCCYIS